MSIVERALRHLRSHLSGLFRFEEFEEPMKVIVAPDGRLVTPAMVAMLRSFDTVLFLPDDAEGALQLQVTIDELDEAGPLRHLCDRWQAYHGPPADVRWALLSIDAAKFEGEFVDGLALTRPNPLAPEEARLCRECNSDPRLAATFKQACNAGLPMRVETPVLVGVDPMGFDVRGEFGVHRLEAPAPLGSAEEARAALRVLAGAGG